MPKKKSKTRTSIRKTKIKQPKEHKQEIKTTKTEQVLIDNFVALQKVYTNMAVKFDKLSDQIAKLLDLFEISAKSLAEKNADIIEKTSNQEVLKKINEVLEQNKIIAKGISLIHETEPVEPGFIKQRGDSDKIGTSESAPPKSKNQQTPPGYIKSIAQPQPPRFKTLPKY